MDMSRDAAWLLKEKYNGEKTPDFFADCERLEVGEPLAYVIGFAPFLDTKIWLDSKPLIPRSETEHWVQTVITDMHKETGADMHHSVLDLCAGSGAVGVAVAEAVPQARVHFAEKEPRHKAPRAIMPPSPATSVTTASITPAHVCLVVTSLSTFPKARATISFFQILRTSTRKSTVRKRASKTLSHTSRFMAVWVAWKLLRASYMTHQTISYRMVSSGLSMSPSRLKQ
jgi:hypothetical protein